MKKKNHKKVTYLSLKLNKIFFSKKYNCMSKIFSKIDLKFIYVCVYIYIYIYILKKILSFIIMFKSQPNL